MSRSGEQPAVRAGRGWFGIRRPLPPAVLHVTYYKAGSQWIHEILRQCAPDRVVAPRADGSQFLDEPVVEGLVYPTLYLTREELDGADLPARWRRFVVIRDLRDTLISGYFSIKVSHAPFQDPAVASLRERLRAMDFDEGLALTMREWLPTNGRILRSWVDSGECLIRYEDLLEHDEEILTRVLIEDCELGVAPWRVRRAIRRARFDRLTRGRERGQEDVASHRRKAVAGDWRNYFTDEINEEFMSIWGPLLDASGYPADGPPGAPGDRRQDGGIGYPVEGSRQSGQ